MNMQAAILKIWKYFLIDNNPPSLSKDSQNCLLRGPGGCRCAVGVLIPDEEYSQALEAYSMRRLLEFPELRRCFSPEIDAGFLECMQEVHDDAAVTRDENDGMFLRNTDEVFRTLLEQKLRRVADRLHLEVPR